MGFQDDTLAELEAEIDITGAKEVLFIQLGQPKIDLGIGKNPSRRGEVKVEPGEIPFSRHHGKEAEKQSGSTQRDQHPVDHKKSHCHHGERDSQKNSAARSKGHLKSLPYSAPGSSLQPR